MTVKPLLFCIAGGILMASCEEEKKTTSASPEVKEEIHKSDTLNPQLLGYAEIDTTSTTIQYWIDSAPPLSRLDSFLLNPLDLQAYKQATRGANTSGWNRDSLYRPDYDGFRLGFFIFRGRLETPMILVYRRHLENPKNGNQYGYFMEDRDTILHIESKWPDPDLGDLNLVGLTSPELKALHGDPAWTRGDCWVYAYQNNILIARIFQDQVSVFSYARLNFTPESVDDIPESHFVLKGHHLWSRNEKSENRNQKSIIFSAYLS